MDVDNLAKLEILDIPSILDVIRTRYQTGDIYTKCGEIIIAVNPFRDLKVYTDQYHERYKQTYWPKDLKPHIFYTAECALRNMLESHTNQAIIVSGESGSGKTESTKYMLRHLMHSSVADKDTPLLKKIIQVNPLLEAFGNAQTSMNRNSSRFGKYTEVCFNKERAITGAIIRDYMLEKSRLVHQSPGEGNFHVFYAFFAGADLNQYNLTKIINYRILKNTNTSLLKDIHRFKNLYNQIIGIFKTLNFTNEDINIVERILASIIHLTQVEFNIESTQGISIKSTPALDMVARLLNLDFEQLKWALLNKTLNMPDESVATQRNERQAEEGRDALAKALYERLFGWLVRKINEGIMPLKMEGCVIGILDISGFENLGRNSFEQLCINIMNERLQNYLNQHIFECEKQIYAAEGVNVDEGGIDFNDNGEIIEMLTKPPCCLLNIVNEESHLPETNHISLVEKMDTSFKYCHHYKASEATNGDFCIQHFAGEVWYNTYSFLEKNKDELSQDLMACLQDSLDDFISDLFTVRKGPTGTISVTQFQYRPSRQLTLETRLEHERRSQRRVQKVLITKPDKTVISYLKASMESLLQILNESEPHFVRCIKPNDCHRPDIFSDEIVKIQLIYSGIAEAAKIRKLGFPFRISFREFIQRYIAVTIPLTIEGDDKTKAHAILSYLNINPKDFRLGTNKVFLKKPAYIYIAKCLKIRQNLSAIKLQKFMRSVREKSVQNQNRTQDLGRSSLRRRNIHQQKKSVLFEKNQLNESIVSEGAVPLFNITSPLGLISTDRGRSKKSKKKKKKGPKTSDDDDDDEEEDMQAWDIFQAVADDPYTNTIQHANLIKMIKIIFYIFLFVMVLSTAVTQKLSFFALINQMTSSTNKANKETFYTFIVIAVCIPYGLTVLMSMGKVLFGSKKRVGFKTAVKVLLFESIHSVSLSLLVFDILPKIGILPGIVLMNSTAFIPSLLRALFTPTKVNEISSSSNNNVPSRQSPVKSKTWKRAIIKLFDILSVMIQLSGIIIFVIFKEGLKDHEKVECVLSFLFVSFYYWENFYDGCDLIPKFNKVLMEIKYELQHVRHFMNMIAYTWKIMLTLLCAYLLRSKDFNVVLTEPIDKNVNIYLPLILLCLCTAFGYYFAYLACKLCMQEVAFAIPLLLSTPASIFVSLIFCWQDMKLPVNHPFTFMTQCMWNKNDNNFNIICLAIGSLLYVSIYWIARHIYRSEQSRLMRRELLFLNPYYCTVFFEQGILMSRRRHNYDIQWDNNGKYFYKYEDIDKEPEENLREKKYYPKVYACATMWHETPNEMMQILKSIFRMSIEQQVRKDMKELEKDDEGYFEFEAHIFFDDAMTLNDNEDITVNKFVQTFVSKIDEAASSVMKIPVTLEPPAKIITPYGGQLLWVLQSDVLLYVHLKDKNKIRHKKRWSQVMYMYYLLGHRLTRMCEDDLLDKINRSEDLHQVDVFEFLNDDVNKTAENTFLLALDGDVDFNPDSVKLLIDLLLKNNKVGAACGRIHPIGSGPIVWFQIFEYAVGHWLQKATEHVFGCVLCSPGCFSLFRGSALMDTNVMRKYTFMPTEPKHYLQYDQGEDRWLCTLLLQQGYRVDYCAAADAYTYAPDTFSEFFNQRRRWMPSTLANILDLLASFKTTVQKNNNISMLYMLYQLALMVSTMIGPATVMMMISSSMVAVFELNIQTAYALVLAPNILYTILCFYAPSNLQINVACILTAIYSFIMMAVLVNVVMQAAKTSIFNPGVVVITAMVVLFLVTALLHPQEISCLLPGVLYFLCIPSGYLLLVIYSLCNMHVVSWGTREVKAKLTKKQMLLAKEEEELKAKMKKETFFSKFFHFPAAIEFGEMIKASQMKKENEVLKALAVINANISKLLAEKNIEPERISVNSSKQEVNDSEKKPSITFEDDEENEEAEVEDIQEKSLIPAWASSLGKGIIVELNDEEKTFWNGLIKKYLFPINSNKEEEEKAQEDLIVFRTTMCFAMIIINLLWVSINYMFQLENKNTPDISIHGVKVFSVVFLSIFTALFTLQFVGMLMHRWGTFLHVISYTNIGNPFRKRQRANNFLDRECCREIIRKLRYEPVPDYEDRVEINRVQKEFEQRVERHIEKTEKKMQEEKYIAKNIEHKKIGRVVRESIRHRNKTIGLTIYRRPGGRKFESRYDRKDFPATTGLKRNEQRRNLQLVSRKNLRKDMDRLLRQSTVTPGTLRRGGGGGGGAAAVAGGGAAAAAAAAGGGVSEH